MIAVIAAGGLSAAGRPAMAAPPTRPVATSVVAKAPPSPARFDGATLLKGFFFGLGPAAARYPDLVMVRVEGTADATARLDSLIADAEAREPGFLDRFATAMYSGNYLEIDAAAQHASLLLRDAARARYGEVSGTDEGGSGTCLNIIAVLNVVLAFNFYVGAAAAMAITIAVAINFYTPSAIAPEDRPRSLLAEQWVDDVAQTLKAG